MRGASEMLTGCVAAGARTRCVLSGVSDATCGVVASSERTAHSVPHPISPDETLPDAGVSWWQHGMLQSDIAA